jgi:formate dehydrogenase assembly factor FdhD
MKRARPGSSWVAMIRAKKPKKAMVTRPKPEPSAAPEAKAVEAEAAMRIRVERVRFMMCSFPRPLCLAVVFLYSEEHAKVENKFKKIIIF